MPNKVKWGVAAVIWREPSGSGGGCGIPPGSVLVMDGIGAGPIYVAQDIPGAMRWIERYDANREHVLVVVNSSALVCPDNPEHERCGRTSDQ